MPVGLVKVLSLHWLMLCRVHDRKRSYLPILIPRNHNLIYKPNQNLTDNQQGFSFILSYIYKQVVILEGWRKETQDKMYGTQLSLVIRSILLLRISPVASQKCSSDTTCFSFLWSIWVLLLMLSCLKATPGSFQGLYLPLYSGMTLGGTQGILWNAGDWTQVAICKPRNLLAVLSLGPFLGKFFPICLPNPTHGAYPFCMFSKHI